MHDPLVVVCEIRRPLPKVRIMKQRYKRSGAYYDALSPAKKLLHNFRSPYWRFGRVELYWPSIATIWLEVRGFDAAKAFRVTYNADRVVEKSDG